MNSIAASAVWLNQGQIAASREATPRATWLAGGLLTAYLLVNEANLPGSSFDWQDVLRLAVCGMCGIFGFAYLPQTMVYFGNGIAGLCLLFATWAVLIIPFSGNPPFSAVCCVTLWATILFAPAALLHLGGRRFLQISLGTLLFILAGSWITFFAFPSVAWKVALGETQRFAGLNHPNSTAGQATLLLGMLLILRVHLGTPWKRLLLPLGLAAATLPVTDSRTNLVTSAAVVCLVVIRRERFLYVGLLVVLVVASALFFVGLGTFDFNDQVGQLARSGNAEEIYNLTGRTDMWRYILDRIAQSPIMGWGHGCARYATAGHAHNLWLNVTLTTGVIGLAMVAAMILPLVFQAIVRPSAFPDLILLYILLRGMTTSPLFNPIPGCASLFFISAICWRAMGMNLREGKA